MSEVLVSGYYGDKNAGDEAILAGLIRAIRELEPETTFTVISKKAAYTRALHHVAAVSRNDFKHTWKAAARADLILSGGGSLLQDVTSTKSLIYYLGIMTMGKLLRKPVMLCAQGIGPITRTASRALTPLVVNGVDQITVRDPESAGTLRRLGVFRPPVTVTADAALALGPSDPERGAALLRTAGLDPGRPILGVSVRPWRLDGPSWERQLAQALDTLAAETGGQVLFVPMQVSADVPVAQRVAAAMSARSTILEAELQQEEVRAIIARCDLMVGLRFHALVFAAMNGVPLVGLSYDPKNDSFLHSIGEEAVGRTRHLDPSAVVAAARRALSDAPAIRARFMTKVAELTQLSRKNAELAVQLLRQRGVSR